MKKFLKMKFVSVPLVTIVLLAVMVGVAYAVSATPSTNEINKVNNWSHFNVVSVGVGEVTVEFVQPRPFYACFEYRTDGDTSQMIGANNYNTLILDGLYPFFCLPTVGSQTHTFNASGYIEIRMVFGGESDERFDWTRVDVLPSGAEGSWKIINRYMATFRRTSKTPHRILHCSIYVPTDPKGNPVKDYVFPKAYIAQECSEEGEPQTWAGYELYRGWVKKNIYTGELHFGNHFFGVYE